MIAPRWRKVVRDAWVHKPRTALVAAAIVIGITGAGSVLDTYSVVRKVTIDEYRASDPASATLRTDSVDAPMLAAVHALPGVERVQARRALVASVRTEAGPQTAMLFAVDDFTAIAIGKVKTEQGAWPPPDGEVVIEKSSVEFAETGVGQSLAYQYSDHPPRSLRVVGIARDVGLAPGWMEHVVYGFASRATLAQLGAPSTLNELQIVVRDRGLSRDGVREIAYAAKSLLERTGHPVANVDVPVPGRHVHAGQINSLLLTQAAFGFLALALSGILVVNLVGAMLAGQGREIGSMKAIGASSAQIARMYLGFGLGLGVIACAVALPAASAIGHAYARFTADLLNFSVDGVPIPRVAIVAELAVGLLLPVVAAAIPVERGCRVSVGAALRDYGIDAAPGRGHRVSRWSQSVARPLSLALRNAFRRRRRTVLTVFTLGAGGAVYIGALNLRTSVIGAVDLLYSSQRFDLAAAFARPHRADSLEAAVASLNGVAAVEAWSAGRGALAHADGTLGNSFPIAAPPATSRLFVPKVARGRWLGASDSAGRAIVVNARLLDDEPAMVPGATVTLVIAGQRAEWTVVGVVETGPAPAAFAARGTLADIVSGGLVDRAQIVASRHDAASLFDLAQRLRPELSAAGFDVLSSQRVDASRGAVEDHLLMVVGFLAIMSWLTIAVGGLGLAATMSVAVLERTREIGVLRAIGARHRSILAMIEIEGLVIGLGSWAVALPLSVPMSAVLGTAFGRIMLPVPITFVPNAGAAMRWLAIVVAVAAASCAWPAWRAMRVTAARALNYE